jgi:undecaprenyl diphosphate synthase
MDGNGRWALARGLPRAAGHRAGVENVRTVVEASVEAGIRHLTLYAFSTENWSRPPEEVRGLLGLIDYYLERELNALDRNGVRLRHLGSLEGLPPATRRRIERAVQRTGRNDRLHLNIAFNYGGRAEIVQAACRLLRSGMAPEQVTEDRLAACLDTAGQPDLDLVIRTGGEMRLSNFLLWQAAYAEIYVSQAYWPDFGREEFMQALEAYASRQRRFGRVPDPAQASAA